VLLPKSRESYVSEVSVWVTFVMRVQAESVDVLMVVSGIEADEVPITTSCKRSRAITLGLLILSDLKNDRHPTHQISKKP